MVPSIDGEGPVNTPLSTGQVVQVLGTTEATLSELIRTQKIQPPPVVAGRRLWASTHIEAAREALRCESARSVSTSNQEEVDHVS